MTSTLSLKLGIGTMILGVAGFFYGSTYAAPKHLRLIEEEKAIINKAQTPNLSKEQLNGLDARIRNIRASSDYIVQKNKHEEQEKSAPLNNNIAKLRILMCAGGAHWVCKEMEKEDSELEKSLKGKRK